MARGVNKVILIGNLGMDPEVRHMPNGSPVATLNIATSESWKDKQTGEQHDRTEWHRIVLFQRLAEIAESYLKKGSKIYIEGRLQTRKWRDKAGQDRYTTEIIANELHMLDSRHAHVEGSPSAVEYPESTQPYQKQENTKAIEAESDSLYEDVPF